MTTIGWDLRLAVRALVKSPWLSALVVVSLGLGIGANTTLFTVANGVLLRELPYRDPGTLVTVWERSPAGSRALVSAPNFVDWSGARGFIDRMAAFRPWGFVLTGGTEPERVNGARVSSDLFPLLGVEPIAGRTFLAEEDRFGAARVAVLGEGFWRRHFAADPGIVGQTLALNHEGYRIVGVMPQRFRLPDAEVYVPLALEPFALQQRGSRALTVIGRLTPGTTPARANAGMQSFARDSEGRPLAIVVPLDEYVAGGVRSTVFLVWSAVAIMLVIAGANASNLLLVRAGARQRDVALCLALGASRWRIARELLFESVLLAVGGAALGLLLARAGTGLFVLLAPPGFPRLYDIVVNPAVLLFAVTTSVLSGVIFGLAPALRSSRQQFDAALNERVSVGGPRRSRMSHMAITLQISLAVAVLICSGLLVRSFVTVLAVDLGFQPDHVLAMSISLPQPKYDDPSRRILFFGALARQAESVPGVAASGLVSHLPLRGQRLSTDVVLDGRPAPRPGEASTVELVTVGGRFFDALGIPLLKGRGFSDRDAAGGPLVVVISDTMARRFWPGADPIGQHLVVGATSGADTRPRTIVGVAGDVRATSAEAEPEPTVYLPYVQSPWPTMTVVVRTTGDPSGSGAALRREVYGLDRDQPVTGVMAMDEIVGRSLGARRFQMWLVGVFAALSLMLAVVGVYGVTAYGVGLRTQEFGVRVALGARRGDILRIAVSDAVRFASAGTALGVCIALAAAHGIRAVLFGVTPNDPLTFAVVSAGTLLTVLVASSLAGRRATDADPTAAMQRR